MSASALARESRATRLAALAGLGLLVLAAAFATEMRSAWSVWLSSTAYGHCLLVAPVAAFLAWERRRRFDPALLRPVLSPALPALLAALVWLVADRLGLMEGRQLAALAMAELFVVALIGWQLARAFAVPLAYLVFLVPFGAFLVPVLQEFTAWFMATGLTLMHIPNYADGNIIDIPEGRFFVAEACAGLRFLVASVAFGGLYAATMYRSTGRRAAFLLASAAVPVVANGFRALGIVSIGHWLGNVQAVEADHIIYGWVFFSAVTVSLALAGLPFRQVGLRDWAARAQRGPGARPGVAAALLLLVGCLGPAVALAWAGDSPAPAGGVAAPPGCEGSDVAGAGVQRFTCGAVTVAVTSLRFPGSTTPDVLFHARGLPADDEETDVARAGTVWIGGRPVNGGLRARVALAWDGLRPGAPPAVVTQVAARGGTAEERARWSAAFAAERPQ